MSEFAEIKVEDNIIYVKHPDNPVKEKGEKLNRELEEVLKKVSLNKTIIMCNDFSETKIGLSKDIAEYKETGVTFFNSKKHLNIFTVFIISNPVIRVIAGTVGILTGQKIHFVKNMQEAQSFIKDYLAKLG